MSAPATPVLDEIFARHPRTQGGLLQALREVQARLCHVSPEAVAHAAAWCGVTVAEVRAVVAFYHFLSDTPRGRYTIALSDGVTDRMLGSEELRRRLCERLGVADGVTRADGRVSVHRTSCTGLCDQGPAGLVNERPLVRLTAERVDEIADLVEREVPVEQWSAAFFAVENPVWRRDLTLTHPVAPGAALATLLQPDFAVGVTRVLDDLKASGLRGRGGAGFPTWRKWDACRRAEGPKVITCNADEGEPGTFKDRLLLMAWADEVIEGMTLAALCVGASTGFIYLRAEYAFIAPHLQTVLERRRAAGLLGADVSGSGAAFDIALHLGAGAYVCGEETALIESLEGKRGIPRTRPPFPVERGYLSMPTANNNVETFVQAAQIALHGAAWFRAKGTETSPGTRLLSVAGDVARPGLYEVPWGVTVEEVLADCGAVDVGAVLVGGPSGRLVPPGDFQRRVAFEDLATGGAFTVFGRHRDLLEVARRFTHFFAEESCGFCTPCRVGCVQLTTIADRLMAGGGSARDVARVHEVADLMQRLSHCGLGQTAPHPLVDVLTAFPGAIAGRLRPDDDAFDLAAATVDMRAIPLPEKP